MSKKLDDKSVETLVLDLVQGVLDVNELNLAKGNQRQAFLTALEQRPAILTRVSKMNEEHFFTVAIKNNPEYFVHLSRNQFTNELAQLYLFARFTKGGAKKNNPPAPGSNGLLVRKSLDERIVFTYSYVSGESEEIYYLDRELQVPVSLKSSFVLTVKLDNAVDFIEKLDTHVTQLGEEKIKSVLSDLIKNHYKSYLNSYIVKNQVGYYTLCASLNSVEEGFVEYIAKVFKPFGLSVSNFIIKNIAIPKDIQFKLEDQAFEIRQRRADVEADAEFAKISLESYEAKIKIHSKYPDAEVTLTEYEKDLALRRYLTKTGRDVGSSVDRTISISRETLRADKTVDKPDDIIPEIPTKPNVFKRAFKILSCCALLISVITLFINAGAGLIMLGISILILGLVAAFNTERFADVKVQPSIIEPINPTTTASAGENSASNESVDSEEN